MIGLDAVRAKRYGRTTLCRQKGIGSQCPSITILKASMCLCRDVQRFQHYSTLLHTLGCMAGCGAMLCRWVRFLTRGLALASCQPRRSGPYSGPMCRRNTLWYPIVWPVSSAVHPLAGFPLPSRLFDPRHKCPRILLPLATIDEKTFTSDRLWLCLACSCGTVPYAVCAWRMNICGSARSVRGRTFKRFMSRRKSYMEITRTFLSLAVCQTWLRSGSLLQAGRPHLTRARVRHRR